MFPFRTPSDLCLSCTAAYWNLRRYRIRISFFSVLFFLAEAGGASPPQPLTTVRELQALTNWDTRSPHPVRLVGIVTLVDALRQLVVIEDPTGAVALSVDRLPGSIRPGQQVAVTATDSQPYFNLLPDYPARPTSRGFLQNFEAPSNQSEHYVARARGYLHPPRTGLYQFWIASDDTSDLWLSETDRVEDAIRLARVDSWVTPRDWGRYPLQRSKSIALEAGKRYYIEAFLEQGDGDDNLSVAWQGPDLPQQVVAGEYLSPFAEMANGDNFSKDEAPTALPIGKISWDVWKGAAVDGTWRLIAGRPFASRLSISNAEFTFLGTGTIPDPRPMQAEQPMAIGDNYRWSELEGTVDFVSRENDSIVLDLLDGEKRIRAVIPQWKGSELQRLRHRRVRLQGVAEASMNVANESVLATLWVSMEGGFRVMEPVPYPALFRPATISELLTSKERLLHEQPVSISGEVVEGAGTRTLVLRDSGVFTGYVSADGATWEQVGSTADVPIGKLVYAGLAVNSGADSELAIAAFDHVSGLSLNPQQTSVGSPVRDGSLAIEGSAYVVKGTGYGIWDAPHQFHFAYERMDGAGEFVARIVSLKNTDANARTGILICDGLDPDAQFIDLVHTRANGVQLQWRRKADGVTPKTTTGYPAVGPPFWLKLVRHYPTIKVALDNVANVVPGQAVTIIGYLTSRGGVPQLVDASCHVLPKEPDTKEEITLSPPLVDIVKISEASGRPGHLDIFSVRGVVTFSGEVEGHRYLAVQDHTGGTFVRPRGTLFNPLAQVGHLVEIRSHPGWHLPAFGFFADKILNLGQAPEPRPLRHPLEYLLPKRGEGTWIEIEGIVRSVSPSGLLQLKQNGEIFSVFVSHVPTEKLAGWIDSLVRIRGVISFPSEKKPLLLVPGLKDIELVETAAPDPFGLTVKQLGSLTSVNLINQSLHRVKIAGTVTGQDHDSIFVQQGEAAARIETNQNVAVQLGDQIEAVGFPDLAEDKSLIISNALVHHLAPGKPPEPVRVTIDEMLNGQFGGKLVRLNAILLGNGVTNNEQTLELLSNQRIFRASLSGRSNLLSSPPAGSLVEVTGICLLEAVQSDRIRLSATESPILPVRLLVRSPADVVVLEKPRWWAVKRTLLITGIFALGGLIATSWIHLLRKRVSQRTAELANAMAKLKRETQMAATLAERDRLAGEIHDSLAQGFSGLLLQLDSTAKLNGCPAEVRSGLSLARNMVAFSRTEVQHAVWDLQSPLLEDADLGTALAKMAEQLSTETPRITIAMTGSVRRLPSSIEHHLLRIAQEAITNSIKHAHASIVKVVIHYSDVELCLTVHDDGCGFDPAAILSGDLGHFGLRSLRGRAKKIGGDMNIASEPGLGTIVSIRVATHLAE